MRFVAVVCIVLASLGLATCANLNTIDRTTSVPQLSSATNTSKAQNTAIHLDAQQRLVIFGPGGKFCAEASPDAMASYAAALALGASVAGKGAGSGASGQQSNIASIGLRTQAITLMRDALYRLCEATANNTLSPLSATQLLARSQDLTAVVVAVEQLTGAVAANQAILTGRTSAETSASLISDAALLDEARKTEAKKTEELAQARTDDDTQQANFTAQKDKVSKAQSAYDKEANTSPPPADLQTLKQNLKKEQQALSANQNKLDAANAKVEAAEKSLEDARKVRETIESKNSAALTAATTGTGGEGQFSAIEPRIQLSKEATAQVAEAVTTMVTTVLKKDYTIDACMTLMTNPEAFGEKLSATQKEVLELTLTQCQFLLRAKIEQEASNLRVTTYVPDDSSQRLLKKLAADKTFQKQLQEWVNNNFKEGSVTTLIYGNYPVKRQAAIKALNVK